jgi:hypothetical protein
VPLDEFDESLTQPVATDDEAVGGRVGGSANGGSRAAPPASTEVS